MEVAGLLILALDAALGPCSVALVRGSQVISEVEAECERGQSQLLAGLLKTVLDTAGPAIPDLIAVTTGPGSFTGIRAALSIAQGLVTATGSSLAGVTVTEALAAACQTCGDRRLWVVVDNRRGRVFLDRGEGVAVCALDALPAPCGGIAVAGDASVAVAARLAALGHDVHLTDVRRPRARDVARAAAMRLAAGKPPAAALPLYVDEPAARKAEHGIARP